MWATNSHPACVLRAYWWGAVATSTFAPCSMTILNMGIVNPASFSTIQTLAFFRSTTGAASIPGVNLKMVDELI